MIAAITCVWRYLRTSFSVTRPLPFLGDFSYGLSHCIKYFLAGLAVCLSFSCPLAADVCQKGIEPLLLIYDRQAGDETWRNSNNGLYNIDFSDSSGSHLSKFQVLIMPEF